MHKGVSYEIRRLQSLLPEFPDFYWQDFYNLLIKEDLRDLAWNIGVMEYWNDGLRGEKNKRSMPFDFYTQYSTFPLFHHSMWMAPLLQQISLIDNGVLDKIKETPGLLLLTFTGVSCIEGQGKGKFQLRQGGD